MTKQRAFYEYPFLKELWHKSACKLNAFYLRTFGDRHPYSRPKASPQEASDKIYRLLMADNPCMIARFGGGELYCIANYLGVRQGPGSLFKFIRTDAEPWWWMEKRMTAMRDLSGFFPLTEEAIVRFCEMSIRDAEEIDLLGSWMEKEWLVEDLIAGKEKVFLPYLEPYYADRPWTRALAGKKVVVVNFLADLMEQQFRENRTKLFKNPDILPEFELRGVKSVLTYAGDDNGFPTWFDALSWMEQEIDKEDYDICIIGCGAYGFSLAAHVKRSGKKAVHLGGATQLLFGIKGNRWEDPQYGVKEWGIPEGFYTNMFNDYWTKAGAQNKPDNADKIEGACYW
jgi:hypothetical protein